MTLYHDLTQCRFLCRVNRFIARCELDGMPITVHVKNTGRLRELLLPGVLCWLEHSAKSDRKTAYDLVAVEKDGRIINIDSQAPNLIAREWVAGGGWTQGLTGLQSEYPHGNSRYDLTYLHGGRRGLIEVKGVTLFDDAGLACFPDAPTSRGAKHLHGLIGAAQAGMEAGLLFVIMREDAAGLIPNDRTDPAFSSALREAAHAGVRIVGAACRVTAEAATIVRTVPVIL